MPVCTWLPLSGSGDLDTHESRHVRQEEGFIRLSLAMQKWNGGMEGKHFSKSPRQSERDEVPASRRQRRAPKVSDMLQITGLLNSMAIKLSGTMPESAFAKER